jgi:hypothetical protein
VPEGARGRWTEVFRVQVQATECRVEMVRQWRRCLCQRVPDGANREGCESARRGESWGTAIRISMDAHKHTRTNTHTLTHAHTNLKHQQ